MYFKNTITVSGWLLSSVACTTTVNLDTVIWINVSFSKNLVSTRFHSCKYGDFRITGYMVMILHHNLWNVSLGIL